MATLTGKILADFTTSLATALAIGATTASLQSATDDDGVALPSGTYYFTLDGSNSSKEHIRCSLSGTSLTSIYSISRQGVATSGTVRAHRLGATVTLTDFAHIKVINDLINGTTALDSSAPLKYDGTADMTGDENKLATVKYVNDTSIAGGVDASSTVKGISKLSVNPASPTNPIAVGTNDTRVPTQDENDALVGTSGTPSASNKYVTNDDTEGSGSIIRSSLLDNMYFGDGADGDITLDGTTTILGMVPSASKYTMTKDLFFNNLTINTGVTLNGGGYRIYILGTLTNNGTIERNGVAGGNGGNGNLTSPGGTAGTAGATLSSGTIFGSVAAAGGGAGGTNGTSGTIGANGTASTSAMVANNGVNGGAGGAGGTGGGASSAPGGATGTPGTSTYISAPRTPAIASNPYYGSTFLQTTASSAGGGGGGGGNYNGPENRGTGGGGGGSGSNGGFLVIFANTIINSATGIISVNGGNGGNGGNGYSVTGLNSCGGGGGGGGGGGNGGVLAIFYRSLTNSGSITATGGTGGTGGARGTGDGVNGVAGANGTNGNTGIIVSLQV